MITAIVILLRLVGVIWAVGAVLIMKNARASGDSDAARWLFVGGALTFVAGLMLAAGSRFAAIPVVLVVIQQTAFHWRQTRALPPGAPRPTTVHIQIALVVAVATLIFVAKGALR